MAEEFAGLLKGYDPGHSFCELLRAPETAPEQAGEIIRRLDRMKVGALKRRAAASDRELFSLGITFTVYSDKNAIDRVLPFDVIPRVLSSADWTHIEAGCKQRVAAINRFIGDVYGEQRILREGVVPSELVLGNKNFRPEMQGHRVMHGTYVNICGIDLVRDAQGVFRVLEDNARTPSGVSYVVENRHLMQRAFPDLTDNVQIKPVSNYGMKLRDALAEMAPEGVTEPNIALLSPGVFNSAYFEHVFLAREMGVPLVEGRDLLVENGLVQMKTTSGLQRLDVIYRRIDDEFLDPEQFNPHSILGVPGLFDVYRAGRLSLANSVGTGVSDDKAIYAYMPRIIRFFLSEEPILQNVETHLCREQEGLDYTLANMEQLVVKPVGESGGYGVMVGTKASKSEIEKCRAQVKADPGNYIAQPVVDLSVCPTLVGGGIEPRHVDLRPYIVTGKDSWVLPGGLTRVALRKGSLVVNSSQGGGTKDTWVLE